jgi:hypothetical protein
MHIIGDVKGRDCVLLDDMIDTAGTLTNAARALADAGARRVYAAATHAVLSGPAVHRIVDSPLVEVIVTDSIPLRGEAQGNPKFRQASLAQAAGRGDPPHPQQRLHQLALRLRSATVSSPDDSALSAEVRERVARYEARATRLEGTLADYRRRMPIYLKAFAALLALGLASFAFGRLPGTWATISAVVISGGGYMMLRARLWEVEADVTATREEIANLRSGKTPVKARPS